MAQTSTDQSNTIQCLGLQCHLGQAVALILSALILMVIWLSGSTENTSTPIVLTCLSALNIIMLLWSVVVSKPKEKKTYTENQTTIVPPADPLDVLAGVPDLLWTIDYASRRVTSHNNNQIPHHPEGSQFAKLAAIFPARVSRQFLEALIELQDKQTALRFEYTLGNEQVQYTFEARLTPLSHRDCVVIIRDISHIKATEAALFQQQMFTQQIIDSSPNLVFIRDQHGRFLLVNQTTQKLLGHDLLVHSHMGLDEDTPILSAGDQSVLNHGETIRIEDSCTLPNGRTHWFDITKLAVEREGKTYILSIANDITQQKENSLAQTDSGLLVRAIANALPHAFLLVQNGQVLFANRVACARLGLEPEQLIGEALSRLNPQSVNLQQCSSYQLHTIDGQCIDCSVCPVEIMQTQGHLLTLQ